MNYEKKYFSIDNSNKYYLGYYIPDKNWNGWAMPYFEKSIAESIINGVTTNDFQIVYDKYTDCYVCNVPENDRVVESYIIEKKVIDTKEGKKEVYDFGSVGWIWDAYSIEDIKNRNDIQIITPERLIEKDSINLEF